jgi:hypothetical protein
MAKDPDFLSSQRFLSKVANHNFHDATLESIRVLPIRSKREKAKIEVLLSFAHVELLFSVTFMDCANVSLALDFDVLAGNQPYNTARMHGGVRDTIQIQKFMAAQVESWNVRYDDGIGSTGPSGYNDGPSPLSAKQARADSLTLFRLAYFGGELCVVAKSHKIRRLDFGLLRAEA